MRQVERSGIHIKHVKVGNNEAYLESVEKETIGITEIVKEKIERILKCESFKKLRVKFKIKKVLWFNFM